MQQLTHYIYIIVLMFVCFSNNLKADEYTASLGKPAFTLAQLKDRGDAFLNEGKVDDALSCYTVAIDMAPSVSKTSDKLNLMGTYINCGYIYSFHYNNYAHAYNCYQKAEDISIETGETDLLPFIYLNKASIYANYNDSARVMKLYLRAFDASIVENQWTVTLASFTNIIEAIDCYEQRNVVLPLINQFATLNIPNIEMLAYTRKLSDAARNLTEQKWDAAITDIHSAIERIDTTTAMRDRYMMTGNHILANVYFKKHDYAKAISLFLELLDASAQYHAYDCMNLVLSGLKRSYKSLGDTEKYNYYKTIQTDLRDSLFSSRSYAEICDIESSYELGKMENRMEQLEREKRDQMVIATIAIVGSLMFLTMLFLIFKKNRDLNAQNRILFEQNERFMRLQDETERNAQVVKSNTLVTQSNTSAPSETNVNNISSELIDKIKAVMADIDVVTREDFSLSLLAELTDSKERYVSQAINDGLNKNFSVWVAEIRVKEACKRIKDVEHYGNLSIEGIAKSLGYKSRSHFTTIFKKETGLSPSEYQKQAMIKQ